MKILIIGLGNPILSDDGVGVRVAAAVEGSLSANMRRDITVSEASVGGLRLMELMVGYDRVILVDALLPPHASKPGTIHRLTVDDLQAISPTQHSASVHDTTLVTALKTGKQMGLPLPEAVIIYAVEVENVTEFGEHLTPDVAEAIPKVTAAVLAELV